MKIKKFKKITLKAENGSLILKSSISASGGFDSITIIIKYFLTN